VFKFYSNTILPKVYVFPNIIIDSSKLAVYLKKIDWDDLEIILTLKNI